MNDFAVTLDVDWAPDFVLEEVAEMLIRKGVKATWFITHDSPVIRDLGKHPDLFELGLHPNFLPNSTQGGSREEIMEYLLGIAPNAKSMRMHDLFQHSALLRRLHGEYGLQYDSSIFLALSPHIEPHRIKFFGVEGDGLMRLPYHWADYTGMNLNKHEGRMPFEPEMFTRPGMKVFNFHPIHIGLNSVTLGAYERLKANEDVAKVTKAGMASYIDQGEGTKQFFSDFLDYLAETKEATYSLQDLGDKWKQQEKALLTQ